MIRKVLTAALIAAFTFATTPSFACTGISLKAGDGAAIRGRTLEFGFPMQSKVIVVPAGQDMSGTLPDGSKGLIYKSRYAIRRRERARPSRDPRRHQRPGPLGRPVLFPELRQIHRRDAENASHALAGYEFGIWALANFATVDEVREAVKDIVLVPTPAPGLGSPQGAVARRAFLPPGQSRASRWWSSRSTARSRCMTRRSAS